MKFAITGLAMLAALLSGGTAAGTERVGGDNAFSFMALGDMPYNIPGDYVKVDRLIASINSQRPAFTLHVGDIKSGGVPCSDEILQRAYDQLQTFEGALVYTIGDNEWTDCHRQAAGGFDPRERLARVRQMFFARPGKSLGKVPIDLESQAQIMPQHSLYVENTRFSFREVDFIGVHVVGSNNGFEAQDPDAAKEFFARDAANAAWIESGFAKATSSGAKAIVIFMQAEFDQARFPNGSMPRQSGFIRVLDAIEAGAKAFKKPVLVINGDEHFIELTPLRNSKGQRIANTMRLMLYGDGDLHAVRVLVDPASAGVFGFVPMIVPENLDR